jgi:hypothetical protein
MEQQEEPLRVRLELVSFGWGYGPERREGQPQKKKKSGEAKKKGERGTPWAAALNLRKFANPPASMRRRGLTGLDSELQAAVWAAPKAELHYAKVRTDVVALLTERLRALLVPAPDSLGTEEAEAGAGEDDSEHDSDKKNEDDSDEDEDSDDEDSDDEDSSEEDEEEVDDEEGEEEDEEADVVVIAIGLGCEKGKHRSVAVVERLLREECLRTIPIADVGGHASRPVELEVVARHRDIKRGGRGDAASDDSRPFKGRRRAEARQRKRGHAGDEDW